METPIKIGIAVGVSVIFVGAIVAIGQRSERSTPVAATPSATTRPAESSQAEAPMTEEKFLVFMADTLLTEVEPAARQRDHRPGPECEARATTDRTLMKKFCPDAFYKIPTTRPGRPELGSACAELNDCFGCTPDAIKHCDEVRRHAEAAKEAIRGKDRVVQEAPPEGEQGYLYYRDKNVMPVFQVLGDYEAFETAVNAGSPTTEIILRSKLVPVRTRVKVTRDKGERWLKVRVEDGVFLGVEGYAPRSAVVRRLPP